MHQSDAVKRHVWLPLSWCASFLVGAGLAVFAFWKLGAAFLAQPGLQLPQVLALALLFMAPLLMEARWATRRGDGPVRVLTPFGRFEAPVDGTWLDVGWNRSRKFVVWHAGKKEVRLAWTTSAAGAIRAAERISQKLGIPCRVSTAVQEAAQLEAKSARVGLFLGLGLMALAIVVATLLQFLLFNR